MKKETITIGLVVLMLTLSACKGNDKPVAENTSTVTDVQASSKEVSVSESTSSIEESEISSGNPAKEEPNMDNGDSPFVFTRENYPVLDGSTSLRPLGLNISSILLGEPKESVNDLLNFHRTDEAYLYLMNGESDILIAAQGCSQVFDEYKENGFEYDIEPIAMEALVFVVNVDNPVESLTSEQVKKIYSGEITNWASVGGDNLDIVAFQRTETSGSQVMMRECVMTDYELSDAPTELMPADMGGLIDGVASYNNETNAIGYTVFYYADSMKMADGLKILKIDGIEPCNETISSGEYPFRNPYYCVISKDAEENSPERIMYNWLTTDEGQMVVAKSGYVPYSKLDLTGIEPEANTVAPRENKYTRLKEGYIGKYVAGTSNGYIYPFILSSSRSSEAEYWDLYTSGVTRYGFVDENGMIVSDYGYSEITAYDGYWAATDYNGQSYLITFDGKTVIPVNSFNHRTFGPKECIFTSDNNIYIFRSALPENESDKKYDISLRIYDYNGKMTDEREIKLDESIIVNEIGIQYLEDLYAYADDFLAEQYLSIITGDESWRTLYHVLDINTGDLILRNLYSLEMVENQTFIGNPNPETLDYNVLYNRNGKQIGDESFYKLEYIKDNYYATKKTDKAPVVIYQLVENNLVKVTTLDADMFFTEPGLFGAKKLADTEFTLYNPDGSLVDTSDDYTAQNFVNATELGLFYYSQYEYSLYTDINYYPDSIKNSETPIYYSNIIYNSEKEAYEDFIYNVTTKEKIYLDENLGYPEILNGILCCDNKLINLETNEVIFSYNPFLWDNVE